MLNSLFNYFNAFFSNKSIILLYIRFPLTSHQEKCLLPRKQTLTFFYYSSFNIQRFYRKEEY